MTNKHPLPNKMLILISGKQRSGKDTVAKMLQMELGFKIKHFAYPIKVAYAKHRDISLTDLETLKNTDPEIRADLIDYGAAGRLVNKDYWVNQLLPIEWHTIIPDTRFTSEIERCLDTPHMVMTIRVEADRDVRATRGTLSNEDDQSECDLDDYEDWDYVINNNSDLDELQEYVDVIADSIRSYF